MMVTYPNCQMSHHLPDESPFVIVTQITPTLTLGGKRSCRVTGLRANTSYTFTCEDSTSCHRITIRYNHKITIRYFTVTIRYFSDHNQVHFFSRDLSASLVSPKASLGPSMKLRNSQCPLFAPSTFSARRWSSWILVSRRDQQIEYPT